MVDSGLEKRIAALESITTPAAASNENYRNRFMFYGDIGAGKTDLAVKLAEVFSKRICLVYTDSGWSTVLKYPEIAKKTEIIPFGGFSTVETIVDAIEAGVGRYATIDTIIWDTASTAVDLGLRNLVARRKFPKDQYAEDLEGRPHYRLVELKIKELVDKINKSPLHVIYIAHLRTPNEKDIAVGKTFVRPAFPEATFRAIARMCNMVGYVHTKTDNSPRIVQLRGTESVVAKCQVPWIPDDRTYKVDDLPVMLRDWMNK